ncbi:acyl-CoA Delta-9 desaturase-like [Lycorma delicatula]|uniref:acyl-CoA Delta-9 desaturase-like n=1 Tax=Lycorma delicatula TaxID=130591 RepID=UPI003F517CA1
MAPNITSAPTGVLFEDDTLDNIPPVETFSGHNAEKKSESKPYKLQIVWRNVFLFIYLHIAAVYGAYLMFTSAKLFTAVWAFLLYQYSGLGITAGAHRLWAHRSYKANFPLRLILVIGNTLAFENHVYEWARDHRVHHKYSETNADPHNAKRGFFFSHMGWLCCRKHPDVIEKGKGIDMSDLKNDKLLMFQRKFYLLLMPIICFVIPTIVPVYLWGETWKNSWFVSTMFRYTFTLNMTWLVNSAAHMWGQRPYDKFINPSENIGVSIGALGEGWHNYHHTFPWDYKTAELGNYRTNFTTAFIDFFAKIGWAYDLKTVPMAMIKKRVQRTGDGSHPYSHSHEGEVWGWGDKDMPQEDKDDALVTHRKTQ